MTSPIFESMGLEKLDPFFLFLILFILVIALLVFAIIQMRELNFLKRKYARFMSGRNAGSLENELIQIFKDISMLKEHDLRFRTDIKEIKRNLLVCYQKVGIVKYDAFREMGGQLSFSVAMLDKENNGFILNSVHSATGCYVYTKEIQNGMSYIDLGDEEKEALDRAMGISAGERADNA